MPIGYGLGVIMVLKIWLAGFGMWLFLRGLGLHMSAALLSAIGFMFSTSIINWLPWQNSGLYVLLPWLVWAIHNWVQNGRKSALVWVACLVALLLLAGHPESFYRVIIAAALWASGLLLSINIREWGYKILGLMISGGIGLLIGAIQVLPFLQILDDSYRTSVNQAIGTLVSRPPHESGMMLNWVVPRHWGHFSEGVLGGGTGFPEGNAFIGLTPLLGSLLAVGLGVRRRIKIGLAAPWLAIAAMSWILAYDTTLGTFLRGMPGFNALNHARWIITIGFSLLVLSAFGWDWVARRWPTRGVTPRRVWQWGFGAGVGLLLLVEGLVVMSAHGTGFFAQPATGEAVGAFTMVNDSYRGYWLLWTAGVVLATAGAALLWLWPSRLRRYAPLLLIAVTVIDLWRLVFTINGSAPADRYYPETSFIRQTRELVPSTERILVEGDGLPANTALIYGLRDWRTQDPMISRRAYNAATFLSPDLPKNGWNEYNMFLFNTRLPVAPMLGMRYFIFPTTDSRFNPNFPDPPDPGRPPLTRLAFKDGLSLWRAEGVPGFAYLSDNVRAVGSEEEAARWMRALTWEQALDHAALVEAPPGAVASITNDPATSRPGTVEVTEYTPGLVRLTIEANRPTLLVIAESLYPGWRATLDGSPVAILRANYLSQGVVVPAGSHTVELRYEPGAVRSGALLSVAGLGGLAGLAIWARRPRWRLAMARKKGEPQRELAPDQAS